MFGPLVAASHGRRRGCCCVFNALWLVANSCPLLWVLWVCWHFVPRSPPTFGLCLNCPWLLAVVLLGCSQVHLAPAWPTACRVHWRLPRVRSGRRALTPSGWQSLPQGPCGNRIACRLPRSPHKLVGLATARRRCRERVAHLSARAHLFSSCAALGLTCSVQGSLCSSHRVRRLFHGMGNLMPP